MRRISWMSETRTTLKGGCHCGNIGYEYDCPVPIAALQARMCTCSFCIAHGARYVSHPDGRLRVRFGEPGQVQRYRFGTGTADFVFCTRCGVMVFVLSEIDERSYAVLNVNTLQGIDPAAVPAKPVDYNGESTGNRLERRKARWIGQVEIRDPPA